MLVRLLYTSRVADTSSSAMDAILSQARTRNQALGVTGILVYGDGVFLQAIEGGRATINHLYGSIQRDPRHKDVLLLAYAEINQRRFGSWSMGAVNISKLNPNVLLKYAERAELNPYALSGQVSEALLDELIDTASITCRS